jgi:tight adherence protein B
MTALAILSAALAVWLWVDGPSVGPPRVPRGLPVIGALVLATGAVAGLPVRLLLMAGMGAVVARVLRLLWIKRGQGRAAAETGRRVLESCELIAAELAAGSPSGVALRRAADRWSPLSQAARAAELGGDVPGALREAALLPGAVDLRLVAGAWTVAHRTGHGLADALGAVAESVRAAGATRRLVASELASARATARLVAALPLVAWLMGAGSGARPWEFLMGGPLGLACLAGGLATMLAGLWWIEALAQGDSL